MLCEAPPIAMATHSTTSGVAGVEAQRSPQPGAPETPCAQGWGLAKPRPQPPHFIWRYVPRAEWPAASTGDLTPNERRYAEFLRHPARRQEWTAGRVLAKSLLRDAGLTGDVPFHEIEITSRDAAGKGVPPTVAILRKPHRACPGGEMTDGLPDGAAAIASRPESSSSVISPPAQGRWGLDLRLSLSHTRRGMLVACTTAPGASIGVDLVDPSDIRPRAVAAWFTPDEAASIDIRSLRDIAMQWGAKEALYKALCRDEPFAPRLVEAVREGDRWRCRFHHKDVTEHCRLEVHEIDNQIAVIVHAPTGLVRVEQ